MRIRKFLALLVWPVLRVHRSTEAQQRVGALRIEDFQQRLSTKDESATIDGYLQDLRRRARGKAATQAIGLGVAVVVVLVLLRAGVAAVLG